MDFDVNSTQAYIDEYENYIKSLLQIMYESAAIPAELLKK